MNTQQTTIGAIAPVAITAMTNARQEAELCREWADWITKSFEHTNQIFRRGILAATAHGALLNHVKEEGLRLNIIPRGEFGPWLEKHCPEVSWRTCNRWMELATGAAEVLQIRHNVEFAHRGYLALHDAATKPAEELPKPERDLKQKLSDLVANKSQKDLRLEFRGQQPNGQHHPSKMTKEERAAEERKAASGTAVRLAGDLDALREHSLPLLDDASRESLMDACVGLLCPLVPLLSPDARERLLNACIVVNNEVRANKKKKS